MKKCDQCGKVEKGLNFVFDRGEGFWEGKSLCSQCHDRHMRNKKVKDIMYLGAVIFTVVIFWVFIVYGAAGLK